MQGTPTVWSLIFRKCFTLWQDFSIIVVQYLIGSFTFWCMACTAEDVLRLFHNRRYCICIVSIYHARNSTYMLMWRQHVCTLTKTSWDYLIKDSLCCLLSKESLKWQKERKLCGAAIVEPRASGLTTSTLNSSAITQSDAKLKAKGWLSVGVVAQSQSAIRLIEPQSHWVWLPVALHTFLSCPLPLQWFSGSKSFDWLCLDNLYWLFSPREVLPIRLPMLWFTNICNN